MPARPTPPERQAKARIRLGAGETLVSLGLGEAPGLHLAGKLALQGGKGGTPDSLGADALGLRELSHGLPTAQLRPKACSLQGFGQRRP